MLKVSNGSIPISNAILLFNLHLFEVKRYLMLHSYWLGAAFKKGFRRQISLGITKRRGAEIGTGWLRIRSLLTHIGAYSGSFLLPTLRLFSPDPVPQTQIWLIDRQRQTQSSKKAIFFKIDRGPVYHASHVVSNSPMAMSSIPYPMPTYLRILHSC